MTSSLPTIRLLELLSYDSIFKYKISQYLSDVIVATKNITRVPM